MIRIGNPSVVPRLAAGALLLCGTLMTPQSVAQEGRNPIPFQSEGLVTCPHPRETGPIPDREVDARSGALLASALQAALAKAPAQPKGLSVAVLVPGHGWWTAQRGAAGPGRSVGPATRFHAASSGKLITAALVASAAVDTKLDLSTRLGSNPALPAPWSAITLDQLLNHSGGLGSFDENPAYNRLAPATPLELIALTPDALVATPGTSIRYSNTGYILLGLALEQASGRTWGQLVREQLFSALPGCTALTADECTDGTLARGYLSGQPLPFLADYRNAFSAGGIVARPLDLARLYESILQGRIISPAAAEYLRQGMACTSTAPLMTWAGRGINRIETPKGGYLVHGGHIPGFNTVAGLDLGTGVAVAVMANDDAFTPGPLFFGLAEAAAQALAADRTALERWRIRHFGSPENTGPGADDACPRGDGVCNLLKYALNMDADAADSTTMTLGGSRGLPRISADVLGRLTLAFVRRPASGLPGITYTVLFSDDLVRWLPNPAATEAVEPVDSEFERVVVTDSVVAARRFARLLVTP